jgi:NAD(P)-dependent dehydrogenase (short-subunit alcohol dehydrogenase family)
LSGRGALQGQVAIVTGAGRGIGYAVATALAREDATVVLASRTRQQLAATAAAIRESGGAALAIPTDVTQDAAVEAMVEQAMAELGRVDIRRPGSRRSARSPAPSRPTGTGCSRSICAP